MDYLTLQSQLCFESSRSIINRNGGVAPMTYNQFQTIVQSLGDPVLAEPMVTADHLGNSWTPTRADHAEKYGVPSLLELGTLA